MHRPEPTTPTTSPAPPATERASLRQRLRWGVSRFAALLFVLFVAVPVVQVTALRWVDPPRTYTMQERVWEHARKTGRTTPVQQTTLTLDAMGYAPRAAVASEDGLFWVHRGFDWRGVCNALEAQRKGERLRGASTISQQVARNVFLTQHRSWIRKGLEAWYTVLIELIVPKERILEVYLNVAEMGPMVFGIEAAAQHWYRKPASALSHDEAARIIGILPSPRKWTPSGEQGRKRSRHIRNNKVPFPGDPGFETVEQTWSKVPLPWECGTD